MYLVIRDSAGTGYAIPTVAIDEGMGTICSVAIPIQYHNAPDDEAAPPYAEIRGCRVYFEIVQDDQIEREPF